MKNVIYIKNMVCPRCIESVQNVFNEMSIEISDVKLGEVVAKAELTIDDKTALSTKLSAHGFELLQDQKSKLINQIKTLVVEQVHNKKESLKVNFSSLIADQLHQDYSSLSRLFSSVEGVTIEKYILKQKIEKVKELIFYDELTLSEIAYQMNYSSVAHLSSQFKKETGMTPSEFKKMRKPGHESRDLT